MATPTTNRRHWRAGWTVMLITALCRGVLAMLVSLLVWSLIPVALSWHVTVVMSGSMEPALRPGDVVASRPVPVHEVRPGQVLLVDDPDHAGRLRLHRLAKIHHDGTLTLRGDANAADDSTPVQRNAVHGVGALRVPFVGSPAYWVRTHQPTPLVGSAAILLLLLAGACARRDEDDEDDNESPEGTGNGSTTESQPDPLEPATVSEYDDTDIRRAAFAGRPARLAAIGAVTLALIGVTAGAPALAAPFKGSTSTPVNNWSAADIFSRCGAAALTDKPSFYYALDETSGTSAVDSSGNQQNATYSSTGVSHGASKPCSDTRSVTTLNGSGIISTSQKIAAPGPTTFTEEVWFRTTDNHGGSLIAYASTQTGTPSQYDRQLYLDNSAHVIFGVYTGSVKTITTTRQYNDGAWHLAAATLSGSGMKLYVDGALVTSDKSVTTAENAAGYWRIGNSNFSGWTSTPSSQGFIGSLSGAAVYPTALSADRIVAHYAAR